MTLAATATAETAAPAHQSTALGGGTRTAFLIVLIAAIASLYPFGSLIVTSVLPPSNGHPFELWQRLFANIPVLTFMMNSAIVSGGAMVLVSMLLVWLNR